MSRLDILVLKWTTDAVAVAAGADDVTMAIVAAQIPAPL